MPTQPRGFTLIELLVVITLVGLLATTVVVRSGGGYRRAQRATAIDHFATIDQWVRHVTSSQGRPGKLEFDLSEQQINWNFNEAAATKQRNWRLPKPLTIATARTAHEERTSGSVTVNFAAAGTSDTYAVELATPSGEPQTILIAGISGQLVTNLTERELDDLLQTLAAERPDAP